MISIHCLSPGALTEPAFSAKLPIPQGRREQGRCFVITLSRFFIQVPEYGVYASKRHCDERSEEAPPRPPRVLAVAGVAVLRWRSQ
jgi:hypothetical protein